MDPSEEQDDFVAPTEAGDVQSVDKVTCDDVSSCTTVKPVVTTVAPSDGDKETVWEKHGTGIITTIICLVLAVVVIIAFDMWRKCKKRMGAKHSTRPLPVSSSDAGAQGPSSNVFENDPDDPGVEDSVSLTSSLELKKAAQEKQELDDIQERVRSTRRIRHPAGADRTRDDSATRNAPVSTIEMREIESEKETRGLEEKEEAEVLDNEVIVTRL